jgi:hypothetical protein
LLIVVNANCHPDGSVFAVGLPWFGSFTRAYPALCWHADDAPMTRPGLIRARWWCWSRRTVLSPLLEEVGLSGGCEHAGQDSMSLTRGLVRARLVGGM